MESKSKQSCFIITPLYTSPWTVSLLLVQTQPRVPGLQCLVAALKTPPDPAAQDVPPEHTPSCSAPKITCLHFLSLQTATCRLPCFKNGFVGRVIITLITSNPARRWFLDIMRNVTVQVHMVRSTEHMYHVLKVESWHNHNKIV